MGKRGPTTKNWNEQFVETDVYLGGDFTPDAPKPGFTELEKLKRDLRASAKDMNIKTVRYVVDTYYELQKFRIAAGNNTHSKLETEQPHALVGWLEKNFLTLEHNIKSMLDEYAKSQEAGRWLISQYGIGPVITAGFLAHIDPMKCRTAGGVWRFAGLDPTVVWGKGEKRPWNAKLKVLCYHAGESFKRFHKKEECFYGHIYAQRKAYEVAKNLDGGNAEEAARLLLAKKWDKNTVTYKALTEGRLSDGHIDARARRVAVKLLLSHFAHVYYESTTGETPPLPYAISILGHADNIPPPGWGGRAA